MANEVIAAISTPRGEGGIAIVRLSGRGSLAVATAVFRRKRGSFKPRPWRVYLGEVLGRDGEVLDECLLTYFRGPRSYTGEDVVELSIHGGSFVAGRLLEALVSRGARVADPGEFTKRAFLNGRLSLAQAEAVIDVIRSESDVALRNAGKLLRGVLSGEVIAMRSLLLGVMSHIEASLDFPEHDIPELTREEVTKKLAVVERMLETLVATVRAGRVAREGLRIALVGRPNVGKSSLLNVLAGEDRAIVTAIPGTTRDTVEASIVLNGVLVTLIDTAGVRASADLVEQLGIERTHEALHSADVALVLLDSSEALQEGDQELLNLSEDKRRLVLMTKADLPRLAEPPLGDDVMEVSALTQGGISSLKSAIAALAAQATSGEGSLLITNLRHSRLLQEARIHVQEAVAILEAGWDLELIATATRSAYDSLGAITGESVSYDLTESIFADFCIGK